MAQYTIQQARANLGQLIIGQLIKRASAGEGVIIARRKRPVARLIALDLTRKKRVPGKFAGQFRCSADAFDPWL